MHRDEGFAYAIDNGAWTAFKQSAPWDETAFLRLIDSHGAKADWIALPDIVSGGMKSLDFSLSWVERLRGLGRPLLLPVQDGMAPWDVEDAVAAQHLGLFVGGSTDFDNDPRGGWKWRSLPHWAFLSRRVGAYLHVARVNSARWIKECTRVGADSFDGTGPTRFAVETPRLERARAQLALMMED